MTSSSIAPAAIAQPAPQELALTGCWTALGVGTLERKLDALKLPAKTEVIVDGAGVESLDTAGVWIVQKLQQRLRGQGGTVQMRGWSPQFAKLLEVLGKHPDAAPAPAPRPRFLERLGRGAAAALEQGIALLSFVGESALAVMSEQTEPASESVAIGGHQLHEAYVRWSGDKGQTAFRVEDFITEFDRLRDLPELRGEIRKFGSRYFGISLAMPQRTRSAGRG